MKICQNTKCNNTNAITYRQETKYVNDEDNIVTLCPSCKEDNDKYWSDMWADYYANCM